MRSVLSVVHSRKAIHMLMPEEEQKRKRGFASMDRTKQRSIASRGGEAVSQNREHMASIGRKGGQAVSGNREHMANIGRKGGEMRSQHAQASSANLPASGNSPEAEAPQG